VLSQVDERVFGELPRSTRRGDIVEQMIDYAAIQCRLGVPLRSIVRPMLGLYHGRPGARAWRRTLSDSTLLAGADARLLISALREVEKAGVRAADQPPARPSGVEVSTPVVSDPVLS
jgi:tRNA-dihydrouridine synthase A